MVDTTPTVLLLLLGIVEARHSTVGLRRTIKQGV
jgi:hypothetical protein